MTGPDLKTLRNGAVMTEEREKEIRRIVNEIEQDIVDWDYAGDMNTLLAEIDRLRAVNAEMEKKIKELEERISGPVVHPVGEWSNHGTLRK